ncbi:MAG: hypothetical protein ACT4P3_21635 [Betaproteobacteria bacterium]
MLYILECLFFAVAMCTFASFAMQGSLGLKRIAWPLRLALFACAVGTVWPRFDFTLAVTLLGASILAFVHLRGRPGKVDVPA